MRIYEPQNDGLDDTRPNTAIQSLNVGETKRSTTLEPRRRVAGILSLVGAGVLTTATLVIYLLHDPVDNRDNTIQSTEVSQSFTLHPTREIQNIGDVTRGLPVQFLPLSPEQIQVILIKPLTTVVPANSFVGAHDPNESVTASPFTLYSYMSATLINCGDMVSV